MDAFARKTRVAVMVTLDTISQLLYIVGTTAVLRISERLWTFHTHKGEESWRGVLCLASKPALKFKCGCRCTLKLDLEIWVGIKNQVRVPMDRKTQPWNPHRHEIEVNTAFKKQAETSNSESTFKWNASVNGHWNLTCKSESASKRVSATIPTENIRSKIRLKCNCNVIIENMFSDRNRHPNCKRQYKLRSKMFFNLAQRVYL